MYDGDLVDSLGTFITAAFEQARAAKRPHTSDMQDCLNMMNGRPLSASSDSDVDIVMDVSSPIIKGVVGLIRDIFVGSTAAPYTINATPIVELPAKVENELLSRVEADLGMMLAAAGGDVGSVRAQIKDLKSVLLLEENRRAVVAAEAMTQVIADRLHDADWENQFIEFIEHFCIYPAAIMKSPSIKHIASQRWDGDTVAVERDFVRQVENISPFDFYPAPYAEDIQTADYVIERRRMTRNELLALRNAAGYSAEVIDEIFETNPKGSLLGLSDEDKHPASDTIGMEESEITAYDAIGYYGALLNETLAEYGVEFDDDELAGSSEAEVWVVAGRVIKCMLNPDPAGHRPFFKACFERVPGAFWGISPAMRLRDTQRVCTSAARSLIRNMRYSSGPIGEVEKGRVKDGQPVTAVLPNTIRVVSEDNTGSGRPAYNFYTVPSQINELSALFDKYHNTGYDLIGIPRLAFGGTQGIGTVGRTSGGMSIVMNQSTKAIKHALRMIEKGLIEPVIQSFIDYELRTTTDDTLRGDVRVYARGVSGLMEQETQNSNLEWALQSIVPMVGKNDPQTNQPLVPASAVQVLLYKLFKNKGIPTDGIFPDFDKHEAFGNAIAPQINDPTGELPRLDGRSADAAGAIAAANEGM